MWLSLLFLYPNKSISNRSCVAQHKSLISITNHGVHIVMRDCASPNNIRTRTCPEKGRAGAVLVESGEGACSQKHASILWLVEGPKKKSLRGYWSHKVPCAEHDMPARRLLNRDTRLQDKTSITQSLSHTRLHGATVVAGKDGRHVYPSRPTKYSTECEGQHSLFVTL